MDFQWKNVFNYWPFLVSQWSLKLNQTIGWPLPKRLLNGLSLCEDRWHTINSHTFEDIYIRQAPRLRGEVLRVSKWPVWCVRLNRSFGSGLVIDRVNHQRKLIRIVSQLNEFIRLFVIVSTCLRAHLLASLITFSSSSIAAHLSHSNLSPKPTSLDYHSLRRSEGATSESAILWPQLKDISAHLKPSKCR